MENVVSWNKSVRGGESCQLEQKGKRWLSAGTKSEESCSSDLPPHFQEQLGVYKCNHGLVARSKGGHTVDLVTTWDDGDN